MRGSRKEEQRGEENGGGGGVGVEWVGKKKRGPG
jgi:hypothetical protein